MLDTITTGHALRRSRELAGMSERSAARSLGVRRATLRDWEADRVLPDATHVELAAITYGRGAEDIWAERTPLVDPELPGVLVVGSEHVPVWSDGDPGSVDNRDVISRYLGAVRRQRGVDEHDEIALRSDDLAALSMVLDLDDDGLQQILMDLLDLTPAGAQWAIRSMLVGGLVAMVATGALGSSWFAPTASADSTADVRPPAAVAEVVVEDSSDVSTDVSVPGIVVERDGASDAAPTDTSVPEQIVSGDDVPVEISETPLRLDRDEWDREQQELGGQPSDQAPDSPVAPTASAGTDASADSHAVQATNTFHTGTTPQDRAPDRRSQGLPLFAVEHANREVVVEPPLFSVHAPSVRPDLGAPLFTPVTPLQPPSAPGALGPGPSALPPSFS